MIEKKRVESKKFSLTLCPSHHVMLGALDIRSECSQYMSPIPIQLSSYGRSIFFMRFNARDSSPSFKTIIFQINSI